ncbi:MAG: HAD hydrolase-like protein [Butyricicoccaceae bacterium]
MTKSVQYALDKMGISEPDLSSLEHFIGPPLYDEFRRCYNMDDQQAKTAVAAYRERFGTVGWTENILFDGVPELLGALHDAGKKIAIASSKPTVFVRKILHMFEIEQYFDAVSGASLDGRSEQKRRSFSRHSMPSASRSVMMRFWSAIAFMTLRAHARAVFPASA